MSEPAGQQPSLTRRPRSARGTKNTAQKQVATTDSKTAVQPVAPPEASAQPSISEPPIGEKWGEFPPVERQIELEQRLLAWDQKRNRKGHPGPFAEIKLAGADVYWLAAFTAGEGDVVVGTKKLKEPYVKRPDVHSARLSGLHLEGADLSKAQLEGANLDGAHLEGADLRGAQLKQVILYFARLEGATLYGAHLEQTTLYGAHLEGANMEETHLEGADLSGANLERADLWCADLKGAGLVDAGLERAHLFRANLEGANLYRAHLEGANLYGAHLEGADLREAHLEGADLRGAYLTRQVDLREATFDVKTQLAEADLDATLQVADVLWNGVPLIRVEWGQVLCLGDEKEARKQKWPNLFRKIHRISQAYQQYMDRESSATSLDKPALMQLIENLRQQFQDEASNYVTLYLRAARANRQLALALREQGLVEEADRFQYRAQNLQREVFRRQRKLAKYLFSVFLALLTGYGFRMWRIIIAYLALILAFAGAYYGVGFKHPGDISFWQALIVSVTAFHGRVFTNPFTPNIPDAQVIITAIEAVVGLIIEGVFIAMLTQRFFNR